MPLGKMTEKSDIIVCRFYAKKVLRDLRGVWRLLWREAVMVLISPAPSRERVRRACTNQRLWIATSCPTLSKTRMLMLSTGRSYIHRFPFFAAGSPHSLVTSYWVIPTLKPSMISAEPHLKPVARALCMVNREIKRAAIHVTRFIRSSLILYSS